MTLLTNSAKFLAQHSLRDGLCKKLSNCGSFAKTFILSVEQQIDLCNLEARSTACAEAVAKWCCVDLLWSAALVCALDVTDRAQKL